MDNNRERMGERLWWHTLRVVLTLRSAVVRLCAMVEILVRPLLGFELLSLY
jgi:hypothetical protein